MCENKETNGCKRLWGECYTGAPLSFFQRVKKSKFIKNESFIWR